MGDRDTGSHSIVTTGARAAEIIERRGALVVGLTIGVTLLLLVPLFAMGSEEDAPLDPGGEVFDLRDTIAERFSPAVFDVLFVVEARSGNVLTAEVLAELGENLQALREADARGELAAGDLPEQPYLLEVAAPDREEAFAGGFTFVDGVEGALRQALGGELGNGGAADEDVKVAIDALLAAPETSGFRELFAVDARRETETAYGSEIDSWSSPALLLQIGLDNEKLGGGLPEIVVGGDSEVLDRERLQRNMQSLLRGEEQSYRLWAVGADANLQAQDDGERAGPFILLTVIAALAMVGITLRSYWGVALTGAGLGILMIWLKGGANLIGIQGGLVVDLIVPIAMVSLGVDFAIHALRRYREERGRGLLPSVALRTGFTGVLGALTLAMLSGSAAFLSNVTSPIEAVAEFGMATAMAVFTAFIVLGVVVPLVMAHVDELRRRQPTTAGRGGQRRAWPVFGGVGAAASSGLGVIVLVALDEAAGVLLIFGSIAITVGVPLAWLQWRAAPAKGAGSETTGTAALTASGVEMRWIEGLVTGVGRNRTVVLALTALITAGAVFFALRVDAGMDVREFFSHDSDLVVGLDKLDEHLPHHQREAAIIFIEGDLTDISALSAVEALREEIAEHRHVLRDGDGDVRFERDIFTVLSDLMASERALADMRAVTGVELGYAPGEALPRSPAALEAAFDYVVEYGVTSDDGVLVHDPASVREVIAHEPGAGGGQAIVISVPIVGTRAPDVVREASRDLETSLALLDEEPAIDNRGVTGPAFTRQAALDATTQSLQRSFPLAAVSVFVLLIISMRSLRYAVVTIIPIGLVAAWLYGFMGLFGFDLNIVTATIGAVSIGVGIDYAIHLTERYREELVRSADSMDAMARAARGTGVALMTSAASSVAGFVIMAFAPMPLFAAYGLLTALMIFMAVSASLLVLPALLLLVTPRRHGGATANGTGA